MKSTVLRLMVAAAITFGVSAALPVMTGEPAAAAACNISPGTFHAETGHFLFQGVNIRSGPGTNCVSRGLGYTSHSVTYRCWEFGDTVNGHSTWTYLTNNSTGVTGWVSDQFLENYGSTWRC
jgi:hypothetical protein